MKLHRASTHAPVKLEQELGRGGEGSVFAVHGSPDVVAKIYAKPPLPEKIEKLSAMARVAKPALLKIAAWPTDLLLDDKRAVRGFLMPRVASRATLHELYSPKSRANTFPETDFRFLVRATTNIARAFALVHSNGHVIGDVNHGNALVGRDGTVVLIDCDSFQIRDRIRTFTCDVGVPLFTAPELQGKAFRGLRRSANHDAFGLAVVIFHMLFQGRHPFAGVFADGEITIEQAIAEHRFAYSADPQSTRMKPPPGTLALATFGPTIAALFTRAFEQPASNGPRPTALEWIEALEALERSLEQCAASPRHYFPGGSACCWCAVEERTGLLLFGRRLATIGRGALADAKALWRAIEAIPHPGPAPVPNYQPPRPLASRFKIGLKAAFKKFALRLGAFGLFASSMMIVAGLLKAPVFLIWIASFGAVIWSAEPRRTSRALVRAEKAWTTALERWNNECSGSPFDQVLAELRQARLELSLLARRRQQDLQRVLAETNSASLRKYLSAIPIEHMPVNHLTRSQRARLADYGINTAADIDRDPTIILGLLSKKAAEELLAWYRMHTRSYQPLASDRERVAAVERRYEHLEQKLTQQLSEGAERLRQSREQILQSRKQVNGQLEQAWKNLQKQQQQLES